MIPSTCDSASARGPTTIAERPGADEAPPARNAASDPLELISAVEREASSATGAEADPFDVCPCCATIRARFYAYKRLAAESVPLATSSREG